MANIFTLENLEDFSEKLNIDDLYEKKRQHDLNQRALYNKILNRIHVRIKATSNQNKETHFCWYLVPEVILGVPRYDQACCIAYLMDALQKNGFVVKYIHPNTLFLSWGHWIPSYVRNELKKKTGIVVNEYGVKQNAETEAGKGHKEEDSAMYLAKPTEAANQRPKKNYTPIHSYKPLGNLIYHDDVLNIDMDIDK